MNILMILTPKSEVIYLSTKMRVRDAMEVLKKARFNSVLYLMKVVIMLALSLKVTSYGILIKMVMKIHLICA